MTINPSLKACTIKTYGKTYIKISSKYNNRAQKALCAHEL